MIAGYNRIVSGFSPREMLEFFITRYEGKITFSTSLGAEDQVLTDMICSIDRGTRFFTLDTGRLFQEIYDLLQVTEKKYGIRINVYFPDASKVENMVKEHGINLFYESVENRKLCCEIRKIEPLKRALAGMEIWFTGLRREQSVTRTELKAVEWDEAYGVIKVSPLIDWTEAQVWAISGETKSPITICTTKVIRASGACPAQSL